MVRQQRSRWVVRVDGIDTATGALRPRQLGTYPTKRAAQRAATEAAIEERTVLERGTVAWLVDRWLVARTDVSAKTKDQYVWAAGHIKAGLGGIRLDQLDRGDVAVWLDGLANGGQLARQSILTCRMVLRAALADAVDEGVIRRSPAARVAMPRHVVKPPRKREVDAWTDEQVDLFLEALVGHRWAALLRLAVLYGPRRSEILALRWDDIDTDQLTITIDEGLVKLRGGHVWTEAKNARSRRTIPVDPVTMRAFQTHRAAQLQARLAVGPAWRDDTLVVATSLGTPVNPDNFDRDLDKIVRRAGLPRLTSHGLRHTAATHMTRRASDLGELRAAAEVLGHSPEMLMKVYAHALPDSLRRIADRIAARAPT